MSAAEALKAALAAGVSAEIDGDDLVLEASAPPPPAVLDLLSQHKAPIIAMLRWQNRRGKFGSKESICTTARAIVAIGLRLRWAGYLHRVAAD